MYGIQDKINQILRGAETIRKNQSMLTAQSDSIELYHALCDMTKDLTQKTNEVARLRELIEKYVGYLWDECRGSAKALQDELEQINQLTSEKPHNQ
jgi:hypothetical protein